jgi:hypothetical protein
MLSKDGKGQNAVFMAGKNGSLNALHKICVWVEGAINSH